MDYRIVFHPHAVRELDELADFIAEQAGSARALEFVGRIKAYCLGFATFPQRGTQRDDLASGVRLVGFRRRVSIAFTVEVDSVLILGIFYGGRNISLTDIEEGGPQD